MSSTEKPDTIKCRGCGQVGPLTVESSAATSASRGTMDGLNAALTAGLSVDDSSEQISARSAMAGRSPTLPSATNWTATHAATASR